MDEIIAPLYFISDTRRTDVLYIQNFICYEHNGDDYCMVFTSEEAIRKYDEDAERPPWLITRELPELKDVFLFLKKTMETSRCKYLAVNPPHHNTHSSTTVKISDLMLSLAKRILGEA